MLCLQDQGHSYVVVSDKDDEGSDFDKELEDAHILISTPWVAITCVCLPGRAGCGLTSAPLQVSPSISDQVGSWPWSIRGLVLSRSRA